MHDVMLLFFQALSLMLFYFTALSRFHHAAIAIFAFKTLRLNDILNVLLSNDMTLRLGLFRKRLYHHAHIFCHLLRLPLLQFQYWLPLENDGSSTLLSIYFSVLSVSPPCAYLHTFQYAGYKRRCHGTGAPHAMPIAYAYFVFDIFTGSSRRHEYSRHARRRRLILSLFEIIF